MKGKIVLERSGYVGVNILRKTHKTHHEIISHDRAERGLTVKTTRNILERDAGQR